MLGATQTAEALRSVSSAPIIVFGPTVEFEPDVPTLIAKHGKLDGLVEFVNWYRVPASSSLSCRLEALAAQSGVIYIDTISMLCPNDLCPVLVPGTAQLMYVDYGHWSVPGAAYFGKLLKGGSHDL